MHSYKVGIVDVGIGNIQSMVSAISHLGGKPIVSSDAKVLETCSRIILPGVGAFPHGMEALKAHGLDSFLRTYAVSGRPLLGICLGMQLLLESSEEFGHTSGLGIIQGTVQKLDVLDIRMPIRLPNVNWLPTTSVPNKHPISEQLFANIPADASYYFIHSYAAAPTIPAAAATSTYSNVTFTSVAGVDNVIGTQFHPEKSGPHGLQMLHNFIHWK